jgi:RimJ/RimL family protein N-acetyltransferase
MTEPLSLRPAGLDDAKRLFDWRNDPETRAASRNKALLAWDEHNAWLRRALGDPRRRIYVAERGGVAIGTVRVDFLGDACELSWTVAPEHRGAGVGAAMVKLAADGVAVTIWAEIMPGNTASARIAEKAGLSLAGETTGVLRFVRPAKS